MAQTFWIGTFPGLTKEMLQYILDVIEDFCMKEAKK